jgi:hypothetical protein
MIGIFGLGSRWQPAAGGRAKDHFPFVIFHFSFFIAEKTAKSPRSAEGAKKKTIFELCALSLVLCAFYFCSGSSNISAQFSANKVQRTKFKDRLLLLGDLAVFCNEK